MHINVPSFAPRARHWLALSLATTLVTLIGACVDTSSPVDADDVGAHAPGPRVTGPELVRNVGDQLAQLRAVTARFHDIEAAANAEYTVPLTGCVTDPTLGGMGFHFGKASAIDGVVNLLEPEVLLYEPETNGRLRLVAVEYIVPYAIHPRDAAPPELFGQQFKQNDAFELWALHAWIWRENPSGIFADFNPKVNCDAAPAAARMTHAGH